MQDTTNTLRYDMYTRYIGGIAAGQTLVQTAIDNPNAVGNLVDNLTNQGVTLDPVRLHSQPMSPAHIKVTCCFVDVSCMLP